MGILASANICTTAPAVMTQEHNGKKIVGARIPGTLLLNSFSSYGGLPKQDNGLLMWTGNFFMGVPLLGKELHVTNECWEKEDYPLTEMSLLTDLYFVK